MAKYSSYKKNQNFDTFKIVTSLNLRKVFSKIVNFEKIIKFEGIQRTTRILYKSMKKVSEI